MGDNQWETVTFSKVPNRAAAGGSAANKTAFNAAVRAGGTIESTKTYNGGKNVGTGAKTGTGLNAAKLDAETDELRHAKVDLNLSKAIQQARMARSMRTAELSPTVKSSLPSNARSERSCPGHPKS
ncbi:hypothetical protein T492DRAFT_1011006, partial [Pavlovales sp. CCMP2436]